MAGENNNQDQGADKGGQTATMDAPQRFEIDGKLYSLAEAQQAIAAAAKANGETAALRQKVGELESFRRDAESAFINRDVTAYRRAMKAMGKLDQDIDEAVGMIERIKAGEFPSNLNPGQRQGNQIDDDETDDDDEPKSRGNGQRLSQEEMKALVDGITRRVMETVNPEITRIKDWGQKMGKHVKPLAENFYENQLKSRLAADDIFGPVASLQGELADYVLGEARKEFARKIRETGSADDDAFEAAVTTARRVAKVTGLLDAPKRRAGATPYPGSSPAVHGSGGHRSGGGRQREAPLLSAPNADQELLDFVNGAGG